MSINSVAQRRTTILAFVTALVAYAGSSVGATLNLPNVPLYLPASVPPLNMIVLGRDHKLYYEAYNDHSDLNDDGVLDFGYKPTQIDYFGYFDSHKCYTYSGSRFDPTSVTLTKKCSGAWSGDFLNYVTTSRIDALRKVLYGGYRSTDLASLTVLERSFIPEDAHSWGKEYKDVATSGYDITEYTPLSMPAAGTYHLIANTTPLNTTDPLMRVLTDQTVRVWNWLSIERPVAGTQVVTGVNGSGGEIRSNVTPTDYVVRVQVCNPSLPEANCQSYTNGRPKPTGLLQEFGENDSMYFGLLSGSYAKNTSGGVLRREMGSLKDEINTSGDTSGSEDGTFKNFPGIITTMNRLSTTGFGGSYQYNCGWNAAARVMNEGECQMWGNPVGEMMYETMRYFAGKAAPTPAYSIAFGAGEESQLPGGGLPVKTWDNPYSGRPVCSKPFETVISDVNTSYDTDQLPGSAFGSFTNDLPGNLNVATLGDKIWATEFGNFVQPKRIKNKIV
jgi:type IV pilus assembly protein PilY1